MKRIKAIVAVAAVVLAGGLTVLARCQPFIDDTLVKKDAAGKIEKYDGLVEVMAVKQCAKLDTATREKLKPRTLDWLLDVQQQVIDNLDFIADIEPFDGSPGIIDTFDPVDQKVVERVNTFGRQLNAAGTLINQLEFRRLLDSKQSEAARRLVYDYDQEVLREIMAAGAAGDPKESQKQVSRHQYRVGYRDSIAMFHRLLDRAAGVIAENAGALQLPESAAISSQVAAVKAAADKEAKRVAVKALLFKLPLVQQRTVLNKVKELAPLKDAFGAV